MVSMNELIIACGICKKELIKTNNFEESIEELAKKHKLKKFIFKFYEGEKLVKKVAMFLCDECYEKIHSEFEIKYEYELE